MAKARLWSVLTALGALTAGVSADSGDLALPSPSCPALAAAPLVYVLIPNPLGPRTWAERQIEAIRLGVAGAETREESSAVTSFVLLSLHTPGTATAYALEMMEAPRDEPPQVPLRAGRPIGDSPLAAEGRVVGAFEALGIRPEDLVEPPEMPTAALKFADAIDRISALLLRRGFRVEESVGDGASLDVDPEVRYARDGGNARYRKPAPAAEPKPHMMIFAKRVARSIYKILLGVAIGILIWGFVRNTT